MVLRATDEEPDHWKSPSASASDSVVADETKSSDMPPLPPPPPPPLALAGSSATTRSLFDDLVATRRQLDDLSRLSSSQSPGTYPHIYQPLVFHTHPNTPPHHTIFYEQA